MFKGKQREIELLKPENVTINLLPAEADHFPFSTSIVEICQEKILMILRGKVTTY